jgi:hypothetical protein
MFPTILSKTYKRVHLMSSFPPQMSLLEDTGVKLLEEPLNLRACFGGRIYIPVSDIGTITELSCRIEV